MGEKNSFLFAHHLDYLRENRSPDMLLSGGKFSNTGLITSYIFVREKYLQCILIFQISYSLDLTIKQTIKNPMFLEKFKHPIVDKSHLDKFDRQ